MCVDSAYEILFVVCRHACDRRSKENEAWGGGRGGEIRCVREKVFPVPLPLQTGVTQAMKKPTCRPQVDNRLFTGILASIFLDSLSFGLACSGRSDNRERTKMGREENKNEGGEIEERESYRRSHDALPSPPSAFPCFLYPAPLPTI